MKETKFKNTEIGKIPEEWRICNFGDIFTFFSNNTLPRDMLGERGDMHNVHYGDVLIKYGSTLDVEKESIPSIKEEYCYKSTNKIEDGDVIIADTAEDETVGKACEILNVGSRYIVSGLHTIWVRPKGNLFAAKYLGYAMNGTTYHNQLLPLIQGTKVSSISKAAIKDTCIIVPPINEQHSIASALTSIDNLISSLGKLIEKKKNIKQGAMQQLLTGRTRLKGFSEPWVKRKLGDNATIQRGGSPRPIEAYLTTNRDGINWIKIGDVRPNDKFIRHTVEKIIPEGISHSRQVYKGDFILSNSMSFGRPYILDIDGCIHDGWLVIKDYSNTYDMDFLYYILSSDTVFEQYIAMAAGSSVKNLNKEKVANVMLFAPQSLAEQRAIATILNKMDNEITALETKKAKYEAIKQGMMQQLLTGKIRLIS